MDRSATRWLDRKLAKAGVMLGLASYCWAAPGWAQDLPASRYTAQQRQQLLLTVQEVPAPPAPGAAPAPAPAPAAEAPAVPAPISELPGTCAPQEATCCEPDDGCDQGEFWSLTSIFDDCCGENWMTKNNMKIGGSTVQSFTWNWSSPRDRFNGPVTWTDRSNDYQLNQQWLYLEKATSTDECKDWDIGGRVDMVYGTNYRFMTSAGLEDRWDVNTQRSFYGFALPQMYGEVAYKDVKVKAGHFASPVGYLGLDMSSNVVNTLPYTYQYGEPFTHTGALATWQANEKLAIGGGFTRGWDNWDGSGAGSPSLGYIGTATYAFENSTLAGVFLWSQEPNNRFDAAGEREFSGRYLHTLVWTRPFCEKYTYILQSDFGSQGRTSDFAGAREIGTSRWYGINQYLLYQQNDCLLWVGNFEWFRDEGGYRVGSLLPTPTTPGSQVRGLAGDRFGYQGNFYQVTFGPKWMPTKNLYIRPNLRFDWYSGADNNPGGRDPFADGEKDYQALLATDVGITY
jgi:hypothetical protein